MRGPHKQKVAEFNLASDKQECFKRQMRAELKILAFQPMVYHPGDERHQVTNLGAIVAALVDSGIDAQQVAFAPDDGHVGHFVDGIYLCSRVQADDPEWWRRMAPWGVIANMWGAPRFDNLRRAILAATPRLIDRLDSDGNRSIHSDIPIYLHAMWSRLRDMQEKPLQRFLSPLIPLGHAIAHLWFPSLLDRRQAKVLDAIPLVTAESPIAVSRLTRFQQVFGFSGQNVFFSPFPVNERTLVTIGPLGEKNNRIVSVGRWDAHQKNFGLMLRVLNSFLSVHPSWDAVLLGFLPERSKKLVSTCCKDTHNRILLAGVAPHEQIYRQMADSKIFLMTSRHESFGIAAAEALCLGCSVVGPAHIPSVPWFCGSDSGTVATLYTKNGLLDALSAEVQTWEDGNRDPESIATTWRDRVGAKSVANKLLALLSALPESETARHF